jgi:hypothetical protein
MRAPVVVLVALAAIGGYGPAAAAPSAYDIAFVAEFEKACVPGRLRYETSMDAAVDAGWLAIAPDAHAELRAIMEMAESEALDSDLTDTSFEYTAYAKDIDGAEHYLVVSRSSAVIGDPDDPLNPWVFLACHLYNLDATAPLDPEPVTALTGNPISATHPGPGGTITHVWGPPCPMPRTGDTYLSFVAEGSPMAGMVPFTGISLNFTTSGLEPGEAVPDPYC